MNVSEANSQKVTSFLDLQDPLELQAILSSESENEIFDYRLGMLNLTILEQVILNNNTQSFDEAIEILTKKLKSNILKAYINIQDNEGNTCLHYSAYRGNLHFTLTLLALGGNPHIRSNQGLTVLHFAAQGDNPNMILYYNEKFGMSIYETDFNGSNPLHWACYTSAENSVNFLLSLMTDINFQDKNGQTALHIAIHTERIRIIKKLLRKGCDLEIQNNDGKNAYILAQELTGSSSKLSTVILSQKYAKNCFYGGSSRKSYLGCFTSPFMFLFFIAVYSTCVYIFELSYLEEIYKVYFIISIFLLIIIFIIASTSDPGIIPKREQGKSWLVLIGENKNIKLMCPYCKVQKLKFSKHCFACDNCIKEQDHHCNFLDNCIGSENRHLYILFLLMFIIYLSYAYTMSLFVFIIDEPSIEFDSFLPFNFLYKKTVKDSLSVTFMTIGLFICAITIFLLFKQIRHMIILNKVNTMFSTNSHTE